LRTGFQKTGKLYKCSYRLLCVCETICKKISGAALQNRLCVKAGSGADGASVAGYAATEGIATAAYAVITADGGAVGAEHAAYAECAAANLFLFFFVE
jgi:hypothetical protein